MTVAQPLIELDASYARAVPRLSVPWTAAPAPAPELLLLNAELADELGLDAAALRAPAGVALLTGHELPEGVATVAQAYAGHQFGFYQPRLGDGRALLLGEVVDRAGHRRDLHLKGSGRTPFARGGDGRAAVGPMLREYLIGEAMHALGIPTTRGALRRRHRRAGAARAARCPARCSAGWPRATCGWARSSTPPPPATADVLRALADYAIARHHPDAADADNPYLELYRRVVAAQAELVARWMLVGFVHGVMNTDNMTISGETIDYGPCAFMDVFDPATVFSSIDEQGRYAYGNQAAVAQWNLARLGEALLPAHRRGHRRRGGRRRRGGQRVRRRLPGHWDEGMAAKLGLPAPDPKLAEDLAGLLRTQHVDFTSFFRALSAGTARDLFLDRDAFDAWAARRDALLPADRAAVAAAMDRVNPVYIPRNHRVEEALTAATAGDLGPVPHAARRGRAAVHAASGAGGVRGPGRRHPVRHLLRHLTVSPAPGA